MSIFSKIFGDDVFSSIDQKLDNVYTKIPKTQQLKTSEEVTGETIENFLSQTNESEVEQLFDKVSVPSERISRYATYDEINRSVPIIKRIIKVYISNILPKNPVTSKSYLIDEVQNINQESEEVQNNIEFYKRFINEANDYYNIIEMYKEQILTKKLLYGDCFVEIVDIPKESKNVDISQPTQLSGTLLENKINTLNNRLIDKNNLDGLVNEFVDVFFEFPNFPLYEMDSSLFNEEKDEKKDKDEPIKEKKDYTFNDILLKVHKPKNIIVLETNYGSTIGYLEIIQDNNSMRSMSVGDSLSSVVGRLTNMHKKDSEMQNQFVNKMINLIIKKALNQASKNNKFKNNTNATQDELIQNLDPEIHDFIKRLLIEQGLYKKKFNQIHSKIRFIPPGNMVHFTNVSSDYFPYGESIIESLILPCKLYMLAQLSNSVSKLSRSSLIRTWRVDVGSTQMHGQMLQRLKKELYNNRITLNDLSSFKSIPKIMSDFKDLFILTRQGQTPVDVDVQSFGDPSVKVQDLEDSRREIIALSGVPAPYLGYMDTVELREQLVHTNVAFATEITDIQESDIKALNQIIDSIANIRGMQEKPSKYANIKLIPPVVLILQLIEMTLSSVGNIAAVFQNMGVDIDPYHFLEQYVPHINWENFRESADKYKLKNATKQQMQPQDQQMGGGMGGF